MVKAYPLCFGDYMPCDETCSECPYKNACFMRLDLVEYAEKLFRRGWIRYCFKLKRAELEVEQ